MQCQRTKLAFAAADEGFCPYQHFRTRTIWCGLLSLWSCGPWLFTSRLIMFWIVLQQHSTQTAFILRWVVDCSLWCCSCLKIAGRISRTRGSCRDFGLGLRGSSYTTRFALLNVWEWFCCIVYRYDTSLRDWRIPKFEFAMKSVAVQECHKPDAQRNDLLSYCIQKKRSSI